MFGNKRRLIAFDQRAKTREMGAIERLRTTDRHANAVQRNRMVATDAFERMMRRPAGAHIVLSVNLEETFLPAFGENRRQMLMLEAGARQARHRIGRKAETLLLHVKSENLLIAFILSPPSGKSLTLTSTDRASKWRERTRPAARHLDAGRKCHAERTSRNCPGNPQSKCLGTSYPVPPRSRSDLSTRRRSIFPYEPQGPPFPPPSSRAPRSPSTQVRSSQRQPKEQNLWLILRTYHRLRLL